MTLVITKSDRPDKRYKAVFDGEKTIHFGSKGGSTFIDHKDPKKKRCIFSETSCQRRLDYTL